MTSKATYLDLPCERCGNKRKLTKVHKELLKNLSGTSEIEYSQVICVNRTCQKEFEVKLAEKTLKEDAIRVKREEAKAARIRSQVS